MLELLVGTSEREVMLDITGKIQDAIGGQAWAEGAVLIFCPHTTCGLTINEGADPSVRQDLIKFFREIAPYQHGWKHAEGNSDAHIRTSLLGSSLLVPLQNGYLALGRWQSIYLYEGDGPRKRSIWLQFLRA